TFGGIIRDVVAGEPSVLLKKEIYVTAALAGAALYVSLTWLGAPLWPAAIAGAATAFIIRGGALRYGWTLPTHTLPPRNKG
ncbi:MAG TPA: TRIC cation channel family protein, partial [Afifellaceae bacterium]|nr:TRIC cation channel family protein [Afifellaceae bacterium]